jgi:hypothetical protein
MSRLSSPIPSPFGQFSGKRPTIPLQATVPGLRSRLVPSEDGAVDDDDEQSFSLDKDVSISRRRVIGRPNKASSCNLEHLEQRGPKADAKELFKNKQVFPIIGLI